MIYLIYGPNTFAATEAVRQATVDYMPSAIQRVDGNELTPAELPTLLQGVNLFAPSRAVVIKAAAANKPVWDTLGDMAQHVSEDVTLVLVETAVDKRTKTFKTLQKQAKVSECLELNEAQAAAWAQGFVQKAGAAMTPAAARRLVEYVGTDQWQLAFELEKLLLTGDLSADTIAATVEPRPQANVFALLDAAFAKKPQQVAKLLRQCETAEDPYKFFGLLAGQLFQLALLVKAEGKTPETIAKAIGAHPYPLKKLQLVAGRLSKTDLAAAITAVATCDARLKRSGGDPWLLIERALLSIATP